MNAMSADFLDSNILVYLFDDCDPRNRAIAEQLVRNAITSNRAVISHQVVQEVLNVLTRRLGASPSDAVRVFEDVLSPLWAIGPSPALYRQALELQSRVGYSFYDSLILASALAHGCERLISEDFQHGQRIDGLLIHNPFWAG
jgi:predicted nucleic acid-binding protein